MERNTKPVQHHSQSWLTCALWGLLMTPISMLLIYLILDFMPHRLQHFVEITMLEHPFLFGLFFYLCGVVIFHWVGQDEAKNKNWPNCPQLNKEKNE